MRVLHVTPYYDGAWAYGGIPRVAVSLTSALARRGHRVSVWTTDAATEGARLRPPPGQARPWSGPWRLSTGPRGVDVRVFANVSNRLAYRFQFFAPLGLAAELRRHVRQFDVAHLHGVHHLPGAIAARHLAKAGVPYVLAPNGTAPRIERRRLAKYLFDLTVGRHVVSGASCLVAVTPAERRQLLALGVPASKIAVIPNSVDLTEFDPCPDPARFRRRLGLGSGPLVLFLGQLTPRKRVDVLVDAVARLGRPDGRLVIAGNDRGVGAGLRRQVRRLGLGPVTTFTGLLRGRDRLEALAAADVVVYPSRDEVFGLVPIEALLCGRPVIVADDCGAGEVIRDIGGGLVVPQGHAAALATAIGETLDGPGDWAPQVARAGARVRARYASQTIAAEMEALYHDVIARPRVRAECAGSTV